MIDKTAILVNDYQKRKTPDQKFYWSGVLIKTIKLTMLVIL